MFSKMLIANRGEIAARIIATARRMGIRTVAVYSDPDAGSHCVSMADEAVRIGPAPVSESYLRGDAIIAAARMTGADAIHPGYGFLSENPEFAEAVTDAGLTFVGPSADAIRAMGLKDAAKRVMIEAGVPVVPGYLGEDQDPATLAAEANKIGYPILIKARAGGGGKGMRLVNDPSAFGAALESAQREAKEAFGDPACLIEKYITKPRHIEIQIFGDGHGNHLHMFERECSLQRRHQKVIEEAPAPGMPENVRQAMGKAATDAARAIGYRGAGTVEFIVDGSAPLSEDRFWFIEMNTRLQVEHPVSEAITGLDFVELQLKIAAGEALAVSQEDLSIDGWAFEARLYAEDTDNGFLPAIGCLSHLRYPDRAEFQRGEVRIDSGVREGDDISPWYDPMIAKVIAHGPDRNTALGRLSRALEQCELAGTVTNLQFLGALARHRDFRDGNVDTGLIERDMDLLSQKTSPDQTVRAIAAIAGLNLLPGPDPNPHLGWRLWGQAQHSIDLAENNDHRSLSVFILGPQVFRVGDLDVQIEHATDGYVATTDVIRFPFRVCLFDRTVTVFARGETHAFEIADLEADQGAQDQSDGTIKAPLPGLLAQLSVKPGDAVSQGDVLATLEAMKMEHALTATMSGVVRDVFCAEGDQITAGAALLILEPTDAN